MGPVTWILPTESFSQAWASHVCMDLNPHPVLRREHRHDLWVYFVETPGVVAFAPKSRMTTTFLRSAPDDERTPDNRCVVFLCHPHQVTEGKLDLFLLSHDPTFPIA